MDLNNAGGFRRCGEVRTRSRAGGVQVDDNSMRDIFPRSGGENKFIAEGFGNGAPGFEEDFEMRLGGLLKPQGSLTPVASVRMAAGQQRRFGDPHAIFVPTELHFRKWNNHRGIKLTHFVLSVKDDCINQGCAAQTILHLTRALYNVLL